MAGNNDALFTRVPFMQSVFINTAATNLYDFTGTFGTDLFQIWAADATNGGFLRSVVCKYGANNNAATTASNAAVLRLFRSSVGSGSAPTVTQAAFLRDIILPVVTPSTTVPMLDIESIFNEGFGPGEFLLGKITVSQPTNMGWYTTGKGGKF